jgi:hypothetical protein
LMVRGKVNPPIPRSYLPNAVADQYRLICMYPISSEGIAELNRFDGAGGTIATNARQVRVMPPCSRSLIQFRILVTYLLDNYYSEFIMRKIVQLLTGVSSPLDRFHI